MADGPAALEAAGPFGAMGAIAAVIVDSQLPIVLSQLFWSHSVMRVESSLV